MKKSRRMFSLAMLVCLIVGVSTGIRECIGAACALAFVNATLGLEDLEKKMEEKKIVVYVLHGFWENEFTNGCAVVDVSIDLETVMKKLDEIVESKAREYVKVQEDKAEEERGFRYFEIWDENGQSAKFYIVEQYLELSQSMMEAIAESLAKGEGK